MESEKEGEAMSRWNVDRWTRASVLFLAAVLRLPTTGSWVRRQVDVLDHLARKR